MINNPSKNFNKYNLKTPFYCLAPMANISTYPFASQAAEFGADLVWTPMVHTDTILHNWEEAEKILNFSPLRYYIVQLVGQEPKKFANAVKIVEEKLKPLGFDINFACPDKNIVKSGCGGFLMQNPDLILEIISEVKKVTELPVSVKTRAGWDNKEDIFGLAAKLEGKIEMLTVHPRTVKQGFSGEADWSVLKKLKEKYSSSDLLRAESKGVEKFLIVGSGDIKTWQEAIRIQKETDVDGVMIGRGALGRPWIFKEIKEQDDHDASVEEIKTLTLNLAEKANEIWGGKGITESKKHFAWYFKGFSGAAEYRKELMMTNTIDDVRKILT